MKTNEMKLQEVQSSIEKCAGNYLLALLAIVACLSPVMGILTTVGITFTDNVMLAIAIALTSTYIILGCGLAYLKLKERHLIKLTTM